MRREIKDLSPEFIKECSKLKSIIVRPFVSWDYSDVDFKISSECIHYYENVKDISLIDYQKCRKCNLCRLDPKIYGE